MTFLLYVFFHHKAQDSLKILVRALKAYLLKNNLVSFFFLLCLPPPTFVTRDDCIDRCCPRRWVQSDKWLCPSLKKGRKNIRDNLVVHHPLSKRREEGRLDIDPRLASPSQDIWRFCHSVTLVPILCLLLSNSAVPTYSSSVSFLPWTPWL